MILLAPAWVQFDSVAGAGCDWFCQQRKNIQKSVNKVVNANNPFSPEKMKDKILRDMEKAQIKVETPSSRPGYQEISFNSKKRIPPTSARPANPQPNSASTTSMVKKLPWIKIPWLMTTDQQIEAKITSLRNSNKEERKLVEANRRIDVDLKNPKLSFSERAKLQRQKTANEKKIQSMDVTQAGLRAQATTLAKQEIARDQSAIKTSQDRIASLEKRLATASDKPSYFTQLNGKRILIPSQKSELQYQIAFEKLKLQQTTADMKMHEKQFARLNRASGPLKLVNVGGKEMLQQDGKPVFLEKPLTGPVGKPGFHGKQPLKPGLPGPIILTQNR